MQYEQELRDIIQKQPEFLEICQIVASLHLPEATICAGAVRNLVWDNQTKQPSSLIRNNIDVYYKNTSESFEKYLTRQALLQQKYPKYLWNLNNIALPKRHTNQQYFGKTITETIAHFPEQCSAIGVTPDTLGNFNLVAPYGLNDIFEMKVQPTPYFAPDTAQYPTYQKRMQRKNWHKFWPNLTIEK
ncbi:nucleotidyltransferase family protein [Ligilactobacillus ceti]|uniref:Nucleotidyltransferase family protein n=1 Tax=Ligilactobacillus ceti DSM 22408 TaxID=1122146 RepID=A0A0R2KGG8_9LACO|nr:nucleotidyltransferase family protein [Ligilactobacillus ceti]KRN88499.1 hypothetical protein IV53_GL000463 [Ligilactobacillus ceti DSM 22408]